MVTVINYFNRVFDYTVFTDKKSRNYYLESLLTVFLKKMNSLQTTQLTINHRGDIDILGTLLTIQASELTQDYLSLLDRATLKQFMSPAEYEHVLMNPNIRNILSRKNQGNCTELPSLYLAHLASAIERGLLKLSFSSYLSLLISFQGFIAIGQRELDILFFQFSSMQVSCKAAYLKRQAVLPILCPRQPGGNTTLMNLLSLENPVLLENYLNLVCCNLKPLEIQMLMLKRNDNNQNCLHTLAIMGQMESLLLLMRFLVQSIGYGRIGPLLSSLASQRDSNDAAIYFPGTVSDRPSNVFISTLVNSGADEAQWYLENYIDLQWPEERWNGKPLRLYDLVPTVFSTTTSVPLKTIEELAEASEEKLIPKDLVGLKLTQ